MSEALTALAVGLVCGCAAWLTNRSLHDQVVNLQEEIKDVYELLQESVKSGAATKGVPLTQRELLHSEVVREDGLVERSDGTVLEDGKPLDLSKPEGGPLPMDDG